MKTAVIKMPGVDPEIYQFTEPVKAIQKAVGGYFEVHAFPNKLTMYVNEGGPGITEHMMPNVRCICHGATIRGTVLVMNGDNSLKTAQVPEVINTLRKLAVG